ncbi:MAG: helix-turn-helix transcriptional regulator [Actinomycetota bacterium]|nr:helix-turn-helix transcriptional regulator [Actinomycetota bacterium]
MSPDQLSSDPAFLAAYGAVVRQIREDHGLDRKELAEAAKISYSYLSAIESGQKLPSTAVQDAVAGELGVEASELLARANGEVEAGPLPAVQPDTSVRAHMVLADEVPVRASLAGPMAPPTGQMVSSPPDHEPGISPTGALAELQALIPSLSSEDAAMVVSMARRLSGDSDTRRRTSSDRRYRGSSGRGLRTEMYLHFWTMYLEALESRGLDWGHGRRPEPRSYFTTPSAIRGASLSASFARNRLLRHELYVNRGSRTANLELLHELEANRNIVEKVYGHPLEFEDPGRERRAVRIAEYRDGHISRTHEFDDYIDWFIDRGARMRDAIGTYLGAR